MCLIVKAVKVTKFVTICFEILLLIERFPFLNKSFTMGFCLNSTNQKNCLFGDDPPFHWIHFFLLLAKLIWTRLSAYMGSYGIDYQTKT